MNGFQLPAAGSASAPSVHRVLCSVGFVLEQDPREGLKSQPGKGSNPWG